MEIIIHRVNTISDLRNISTEYGCEIDIRSQGSKLILNHEPLQDGDSFFDYLDNYTHGTLILNVKEAGIENLVLSAVRKRNIKNFFLLDVEFPYLYRAARRGERAIAVRYSEDESIDVVHKYRDMVDWVWIDTNTQLPLNGKIVTEFKNMNTCLVCPGLWGHPQDIYPYRKKIQELNFKLTAVMTSLDCVKVWSAPLAAGHDYRL